MKRVIEAEVEYKATIAKAIEKFSRKYPEVSETWKETLEWMCENNVEHFIDDTMGDGTKNNEWSYSIWLKQNGDYVYICVIERA